MDCNAIMTRTEDFLKSRYQLDLQEANTAQLHEALGTAVMALIADEWKASRRNHERVRRAYYFSAEYLMGRMIFNNLFNLGILDSMRELLARRGVDIKSMEEIEDVALGNGGLGRLAACFLDSAATHDVPLDGYGIRYKYGLFKQSFKNGFQVEKADDWQRQGDPWSIRREDKAVNIVFADQTVRAVPYDMAIIGYRSGNIGTLRLFQSEAIEEFDFKLFNDYEYSRAVQEKNMVEDITRVLYPNDSTYEGKRLRLKQQYFLSSAGMQDIVRRYRRVRGSDFTNFAAHCAIQLNDTHPTVSVPELIRLLMNEGLSFDRALDIAARTFSYTNHTIMSEALEAWDVQLFKSVIPDIFDIIEAIDNRLLFNLRERGADEERIARMRIVQNGRIHMANLATFVSTYVNGVANIHTEILKRRVLSDWHAIHPEKFQNKTNGITPRRFLGLCNPELAQLIADKLGSFDFLRNLSLISGLKERIDADAIDRFIEIKNEKKRQLSGLIEKREGVYLPPHFVFDIQVKRMHEYKRQLLNALAILEIYYKLKEGELGDFTPTAFIFGAKAAPGYFRAKGIIKFINEVARIVNSDPFVKDLMRVVFVQNYNCSYAERIIPAADISEQISPAGTEASGTGNMKFMLNGAVTLGTYDGANIEIVKSAGAENNYIFGATVDELEHIGDGYNPKSIYDNDYRVRRTLDALVNGTTCDDGQGVFTEIYNSILYGASWHRPDHYYILKDFDSYFNRKLEAIRDYKNRETFARKCLMNTAAAGEFSSDRTIRDYACELWHIQCGDLQGI